MGLREGGALGVPLARGLHDGCSMPQQDGMAGESNDTIGPAPRRDHIHHLGRGAMTVAAHAAMGVGPVVAQGGQEPSQDQGICRPSRTCARTQACRDEGV